MARRGSMWPSQIRSLSCNYNGKYAKGLFSFSFLPLREEAKPYGVCVYMHALLLLLYNVLKRPHSFRAVNRQKKQVLLSQIWLSTEVVWFPDSRHYLLEKRSTAYFYFPTKWITPQIAFLVLSVCPSFRAWTWHSWWIEHGASLARQSWFLGLSNYDGLTWVATVLGREEGTSSVL